jgi:hypothetical protein
MNCKLNDTSINSLLALCFLFAALGCAASDDRSSSDTSASTATPDTVLYADLLREYRDNQVGANAQYTGKRLIVTGPLDFVHVENGKIVARFSVPAWSGLQLFCEFPESQSTEVGKLKPGQQVSFEGICRGVIPYGRLTLDNCVVR